MPPVTLFPVADGDIQDWTSVPGGAPFFPKIQSSSGHDEASYLSLDETDLFGGSTRWGWTDDANDFVTPQVLPERLIFDRRMLQVPGASGNFTPTLAFDSPSSAFYYTAAGEPGTTVWPVGSFNLRIVVTTANFRVTVQGRLRRVDKDGNFLQFYSALKPNSPLSCGTTGTKVMSGTTLAQSSPSATDRLGAEVRFIRSNDFGNSTIGWSFGNINNDRAQAPVSAPLNKSYLFQTQSMPRVESVKSVGWVGPAVRAKVRDLAENDVICDPFVKSAGVEFFPSPSRDALPVNSETFADFDPVTNPLLRVYKDPATGENWTPAAAIAAQVGLRDVTAGGGVHEVQVASAWKVAQMRFRGSRAVIGPHR